MTSSGGRPFEVTGGYRDVYEEIAPNIALWPAPEWLWNGQAPDTGPWYQGIVRGWMEELGVHIIPGFKGLARIELTREGLRRAKED